MKVRVPTKGKPLAVREGSFTARVYATPSHSYDAYTLVWHDPAKGRCREKFADFEEARHRALEVARRLAVGDSEGAAFSGEERARFRAIVEAAKPTGCSPEIAVAQFAHAHSILGGRSIIDAAREYASRHSVALPAKSLISAVEAFIEDRTQARASARYLGDLRSRLLRNLATAISCNLADLTPDILRDWLSGQKGGPRNFNNNLTALRTFVRFCVSRRWLPKDADLLDGTERRKTDGGTILIWTPQEMSRLLSNCPKAAIPAMAIGAFAGLRHAELARLDWNEINLSEAFVEVQAAKAKTASRRLAPCPPNLVDWLTPHRKERGPIWEPHPNRLHDAFRTAAAGAGLAWRDNALRHSFVSYRLAEIQNVARVALEAGNSPAMVFANYRQIVTPTQATEWFALKPQAH